MALKLFVCLSLVAFAAAADNIPLDETAQKVVDECKQKYNVTDEQAIEVTRKSAEATPEIKDFFLCVTQNLGMFDGVNWNAEAIKNVVKEDEKMKYVEECMEKDVKTMEARERSLALVVCCMEKDAFL
ncbi:UNVERIFIED_CONTAM: hypothetical protein PYX00_010448 [Menopon gallinae]|uniref:Uncharacterized protein n=1 Tax=Menopon gallinae TaxID=328185 RepID=A0AAW2HFI7_9NEOP